MKCWRGCRCCKKKKLCRQRRQLDRAKRFRRDFASSRCNFVQPLDRRFLKSNASKDLSYYRTGVQPDCAPALVFHRWSYANKCDEKERQKLVREALMLNPTLQYSNGTTVSDEALMEAITDHRPEALNEFYSRHGSRLKSVIGNVVHEEGDAHDVLQDILLQIWHEADHYSPKSAKFLPWISPLPHRRPID